MSTATEKLAALNLSTDEIESYKRKFKAFDLDKDGILSVREFATVSRVFGYKLSREEILDIFGKRDLDESGGITFDEFVVGMKERAGMFRKEGDKDFTPYREAFKLYDSKRKGYITGDEAHPVLYHELGFDMDKTERLVDMYDKNRDYRLSLPEFIPFHQCVTELKAKVVEAFRKFDRNNDGFVDKEEATEVLMTQGFAADHIPRIFRYYADGNLSEFAVHWDMPLPEDIDKIFFNYDNDRDGRLSYTEFAVFWNIPLPQPT